VTKLQVSRPFFTVRAPFATADFSSFLLQAQGSGSKLIAFANAGGDTRVALQRVAEGVVGGDEAPGVETLLHRGVPGNVRENAAVKKGLDTWSFVTADYAFGHALERDAVAEVKRPARGRRRSRR
jgi:hypothetical protein